MMVRAGEIADMPLVEGVTAFEAIVQRVEASCTAAIDRASGPGCPPRLREALRYAVFPGGARLRPVLTLAAATACGDPRPHVADAAATAVELVHCASLVHDDLPCFDDAELRRGKRALHRVFGEATALLVGDALIVHAFETLGRAGAVDELCLLATATGATRGIISGQAWENEPAVSVDEVHRAKTASLFGASAAMGALSAGADPEPWRRFGETVGKAYQAADDLSDALLADHESGKSGARDAALGRPSVVRSYGVAGARARVRQLLGEASDKVPSCAREATMRAWLTRFGARVTSL